MPPGVCAGALCAAPRPPAPYTLAWSLVRNAQADSQALGTLVWQGHAAVTRLLLASVSGGNSQVRRYHMGAALPGIQALETAVRADVQRQHLIWVGQRIGCFSVSSRRRQLL